VLKFHPRIERYSHPKKRHDEPDLSLSYNTKKGTNAINNKGVIPIGSQASTNKIAGSITQSHNGLF